jgi:hypothetical protein
MDMQACGMNMQQCSMGIQHEHATQRHEHTALTLTYRLDMYEYMQHGHTSGMDISTCSKDIDMQHGTGLAALNLDIQHRHRHAAHAWTCSIEIDMQQRHAHAALKLNGQLRKHLIQLNKISISRKFCEISVFISKPFLLL